MSIFFVYMLNLFYRVLNKVYKRSFFRKEYLVLSESIFILVYLPISCVVARGFEETVAAVLITSLFRTKAFL
jgi:hypothetical protein